MSNFVNSINSYYTVAIAIQNFKGHVKIRLINADVSLELHFSHCWMTDTNTNTEILNLIFQITDIFEDLPTKPTKMLTSHLMQGRNERGAEGRQPPSPRFCGLDIFPIKKLLKCPVLIKVQAILGNSH